VQNRQYLPNTDQISIIAATILLAYAMAGFISFPEQQLRLEFWSIYVVFSLNAQSIIMIVASILAATGSDWLIRSHPLWNNKNTLEHWALPLLTALVLGFLIGRFEGGTYGWISYILGAAFLMVVLISEYITVNPADVRYPIAVTNLLAITYFLYLIFCVLIRFLDYRLLYTLPSIFFATLLVSLRSFKLRQPQKWSFSEALFISLMTTQLAAALHYWPISPLSFGLCLFGVAYALFLLIYQPNSNPRAKIGYLEPLVLLISSWLLAYWLK